MIYIDDFMSTIEGLPVLYIIQFDTAYSYRNILLEVLMSLLSMQFLGKE